MTKPGIYKIVNKANNKIYVGFATDLKRRWREHKYKLKKGIHSNKHLLSAWKKYGEDSFEFEILEEHESLDKDYLLLRENYYIDLLGSKLNANGYNIREDCRNQIGYKHTEETKEKMRGRVVSEETKKVLSEYAKKQEPYWKGKKRDPAVIEKIKQSKMGKIPWNKGKNYSIDPKLIEKRLNKRFSVEMLEQIAKDYDELGSYRKVAIKHGLDRGLISKIIRHFEMMKL